MQSFTRTVFHQQPQLVQVSEGRADARGWNIPNFRTLLLEAHEKDTDRKAEEDHMKGNIEHMVTQLKYWLYKHRVYNCTFGRLCHKLSVSPYRTPRDNRAFLKTKIEEYYLMAKELLTGICIIWWEMGSRIKILCACHQSAELSFIFKKGSLFPIFIHLPLNFYKIPAVIKIVH